MRRNSPQRPERSREYLDNKARQKVRPEVMAHFHAGLERNRRLYELLA